MKRMFTIGLIMLMCCVAQAAIEFQGMFDYEVSQASVLYLPDPNRGIGAMVMSDSFVPETTEENIMVGPKANFKLNAALKGLLATVLPWMDASQETYVTTYGYVGLVWDVGNDHDMMGILGTEIRLLPDRKIQPTIAVEWLQPEGSANDLEKEVHTVFGVTYTF